MLVVDTTVLPEVTDMAAPGMGVPPVLTTVPVSVPSAGVRVAFTPLAEPFEASETGIVTLW